MTKKYGIRNTSECVLRLKVGKADIVCNFTNGNLQSREPIDASFVTSNPIAQFAIESCEKFKNGKIYIMAEYGDSAPAAVSAKTEQPKKKTKADAVKVEKKERVMENVTTFGDAVTVLAMENDVKGSDLVDIDSCLRKAAELGISFPNLIK